MPIDKGVQVHCWVATQFFIMTRIMADIQRNLQEIRETAVIANTCLEFISWLLMRVNGMPCNSIQ